MYKFSRCHVVVFMVFSFHLPIFDKNRPVFEKIAGKWPHWFSEKLANLSMFPVFTVPLSSPVCFTRIFPIFANFYHFFQKPTGLVTSGFRSSAEFLNIAREPPLARSGIEPDDVLSSKIMEERVEKPAEVGGGGLSWVRRAVVF
jgi:hypothetical protein